MNLPLQFIEQMKAILGNEYSDFESSLHDKLPISIRINPFKTENDLILSDPVAWCTNAYYLNERPSFYLRSIFSCRALLCTRSCIYVYRFYFKIYRITNTR